MQLLHVLHVYSLTLAHNVMHSSSNNSRLVDHQPESDTTAAYTAAIHHRPPTQTETSALTSIGDSFLGLLHHHQFCKQSKSGGVQGQARKEANHK